MPAKNKVTVYPSDEMLAALKAYADERGLSQSAALLDLAAEALSVATPRHPHGGARTATPWECPQCGEDEYERTEDGWRCLWCKYEWQ